MSLLASALLGAAGTPAAGQQATHDPSALMVRAEQEHRAYRMDDALELYEDVVLAQDERSELPRVALERIATIHLAAGRTSRAAEAMDRLAARAEWLGYPEVQARALLESAVLHQQMGSRSAALQRVHRLQPLLGSPHLSLEATARIRSRLRSPAPMAG